MLQASGSVSGESLDSDVGPVVRRSASPARSPYHLEPVAYATYLEEQDAAQARASSSKAARERSPQPSPSLDQFEGMVQRPAKDVVAAVDSEPGVSGQRPPAPPLQLTDTFAGLTLDEDA